MGLLQILYKGTLLTQIPVTISVNGHLVKAALSGGSATNVQFCHMWKQAKNGAADMGGSSQNSNLDGLLEIRFLPNSATELLEGDFIVLEHVAIFGINSE